MTGSGLRLQRLGSARATLVGLGSLVILAGLLLWLAPNEKTLGAGIKPVYLHVALTWTGLVGLTVSALAGLSLLITARPGLDRWAQTIGWVAFGFFAAGFLLSLLASQMNWGGLAWGEPRNLTALNTLAIGLSVQIVNGWPIPLRGRGLLRLLPAAGYGLSAAAAPLILHPRNPITTSSSFGIQFAFFGMFAVCLLAASWLVLYLHSQGASLPRPPMSAAAD
jgi:hypothetical protein